MTNEEVGLKIRGLCHDYRQILAGGSPRPHRPVAVILVEFYEGNHQNIRCIVDGSAHESREDIPLSEFIRRGNTRDDYREAVHALMERAMEWGGGVIDYIQTHYTDRFPRWDVVIRDGMEPRFDILEEAWNGRE